MVIGGGTGAPVSIRTLLSLGVQTSAVVAMADDGGSTGVLREEADATPPGDIRKCLVAFAKDPSDPLVRALKYRFAVARDHAWGTSCSPRWKTPPGRSPRPSPSVSGW